MKVMYYNCSWMNRYWTFRSDPDPTLSQNTDSDLLSKIRFRLKPPGLQTGSLCTANYNELARISVGSFKRACQYNLWLHDALSLLYLLSTAEQETF